MEGKEEERGTEERMMGRKKEKDGEGEEGEGGWRERERGG